MIEHSLNFVDVSKRSSYVQAIQYSRFSGDEEVLDLVNIKSDSLKENQVR